MNVLKALFDFEFLKSLKALEITNLATHHLMDRAVAWVIDITVPFGLMESMFNFVNQILRIPHIYIGAASTTTTLPLLFETTIEISHHLQREGLIVETTIPNNNSITNKEKSSIEREIKSSSSKRQRMTRSMAQQPGSSIVRKIKTIQFSDETTRILKMFPPQQIVCLSGIVNTNDHDFYKSDKIDRNRFPKALHSAPLCGCILRHSKTDALNFKKLESKLRPCVLKLFYPLASNYYYHKNGKIKLFPAAIVLVDDLDLTMDSMQAFVDALKTESIKIEEDDTERNQNEVDETNSNEDSKRHIYQTIGDRVRANCFRADAIATLTQELYMIAQNAPSQSQPSQFLNFASQAFGCSTLNRLMSQQEGNKVREETKNRTNLRKGEIQKSSTDISSLNEEEGGSASLKDWKILFIELGSIWTSSDDLNRVLESLRDSLQNEGNLIPANNGILCHGNVWESDLGQRRSSNRRQSEKQSVGIRSAFVSIYDLLWKSERQEEEFIEEPNIELIKKEDPIVVQEKSSIESTLRKRNRSEVLHENNNKKRIENDKIDVEDCGNAIANTTGHGHTTGHGGGRESDSQKLYITRKENVRQMIELNHFSDLSNDDDEIIVDDLDSKNWLKNEQAVVAEYR